MADDNQIAAQLDSYITELYAPEDDVLLWIRAETERHAIPAISIQAFEGRLLQFLVHACNARKIVEIGTLAGYSGVWLARALPADGRLYTLELSSKHAKVALASFEKAGLLDKVELIQGPALESLAQLAARGPFDMVFIDADKEAYGDYLQWTVENLRPGGLVAAHNALRNGRVLTPESEGDRKMAAFNRALADNSQLQSMILAIGDGMAVGVKQFAD